jgi:hypothetical protein
MNNHSDNDFKNGGFVNETEKRQYLSDTNQKGLKMKNREEMIEQLIEHRLDCWYEWKPYEIADLFRGGLKGYDEMTDEEIKEEYELHFDTDEVQA